MRREEKWLHILNDVWSGLASLEGIDEVEECAGGCVPLDDLVHEVIH